MEHCGIWNRCILEFVRLVYSIDDIAMFSCEGIWCSSFYVKELNVTVHKKYFPCITLLDCWPFCTPKSLANLMVEVETRQSHQILLRIPVWFCQSCTWRSFKFHLIAVSGRQFGPEHLVARTPMGQFSHWFQEINEYPEAKLPYAVGLATVDQ